MYFRKVFSRGKKFYLSVMKNRRIISIIILLLGTQNCRKHREMYAYVPKIKKRHERVLRSDPHKFQQQQFKVGWKSASFLFSYTEKTSTA